MREISFDRPDDPLYRSAPLSHVVELPVLGMRTRFETNSQAVMMAVERTFGGWRSLTAHPELVSSTTVRVRMFVHDGNGDLHDPAALMYRMPDPNRLLLAGPGSFGVVEVDRREAYAFVTPALVRAEMQLRYGVLEAMTFTLLTGAERYPFHAALVELDGVAILLFGPSGSGKSTLAYAASRNGFRLIGEEVAYVQLHPRLRIWGVPGRLRLSREAAAHFPELDHLEPSRLPDGTNKISLWQSAAGGARDFLPIRRMVCCYYVRLSRDCRARRRETIGGVAAFGRAVMFSSAEVVAGGSLSVAPGPPKVKRRAPAAQQREPPSIGCPTVRWI
jgi:hypothetical protein